MTNEHRRTGRTRSPLGRAQSGFTLLEILVGVVILAGGLLGLAYAMVTAYRVEQAAREKKIALGWVSAQLENVRSLGYGGVLESPVPPVRTPPTPPGYLIPVAWGTSSPVGVRKDGPSTTIYFERYFYSDPNKAPSNGAPLYDAALRGLRPSRANGVVGTLIFREPTLPEAGISTGTGYFVTAVVQWSGVAGESSLRVGTFVGR